MYSEYKQPTEENKAQSKKYMRAVQEDYSDKLGTAMGLITTGIVGLVTIVYIIIFAL